MLTSRSAFSSFSVDDLEKARQFYGETLGLTVTEGGMGTLELELPAGARVMLYPKNDHQPATFTVLNFSVTDIEKAVEELNSAGIQTKIYDDADMPTDEKGIMRDEGGPAIAWFKDPAGNVLSVIMV